MNRRAVFLVQLYGGFVLTLAVRGEMPIVFKTKSDLPIQLGSYLRAYASSGTVPVDTRLGNSEGAQLWDFSQPPSADEFVRQKVIVAPNDGGHGELFQGATNVELQTTEPSGDQAWGFY